MTGTTPSARNRRRALGNVACAAMMVLEGCAVGPNFARPKAPPVTGYAPRPLPEVTAATDVHGGAAQHFIRGMDVPGAWWELFHSAPLDALVRRALEANPTLAAAQATLREAEAQLRAGEGALFPTLSGDASRLHERVTTAPEGGNVALPAFTLNAPSLSVSYVFDIWGGTRRGIEALRAEQQFQRFELEASYLTISSNVVTAAINEAALRGEIAATQEIIGIETQEVAGLARQFNIGAAADTAVLAQRAALAQAQAQLPPLQKQLEQQRNQLRAFLGAFPNATLQTRFVLTSLELPKTLPVSLPSRLVEQRPDIRASEALLHQASAQIGVATANMLPQLTLSGSYGAEGVGGLFGPALAVWSIGPGLTQPLFEGGKLYEQRRAAIEAYRAAAAQYRQTVIAAFQNVADALRALETDAAAVSAQAAAQTAAAESLAASQRQFHLGAISYLSLLTAEQTYQQARLNFVEAEATRFSDTAALFEALGGGWWHRADVAQDDPRSRIPPKYDTSAR